MSANQLSTRPGPLVEAAAEPSDDGSPRLRSLLAVVLALLLFVLVAMSAMAAVLVFGAGVDESSELIAEQSSEPVTVEPDSAAVTDTTSADPDAAVTDTTSADPDAAVTDTTSAEPDSAVTDTPAPGPEPTAVVAPADTCSADGYAPSSDQTGLPEAVAVKRELILSAAVACDFVALADLTAELFTGSLGGGDLVTLWSEAEARGETPLLDLVRLLDQPVATMESEGGEFFVWPSAFLRTSWSDVSEAERAGLAVVYTESELAAFGEFGRYVGYRIVIHESGDWLTFVAGD